MDILKIAQALKGYGSRPDGSQKQRGFLGELPSSDGNFMTEYSVNYDGRGDMPSIIPTLHPAELNYILQTQNVPQSIAPKIIKHAEMRAQQGKSPFWNPDQDLFGLGK